MRLLALLLLVAPLPARGEARVSVKARPWFDGVHAVARGLEVRVDGRLRDNLGQPVPQSPVRVRSVDGPSASTTTDPEGAFHATLRFEGEGRRALHVEHPGGALLGPATTALEVVVGRTTVELDVDVAELVTAGEPAEIGLSARDPAGWPVVDLPLTVGLDEGPPVSLRTDRAGRATLPVEGLSPGPHRLVASWAGDEERLPARAEHTFQAAATLSVTLALEGPPPTPGAPVVVTGRVRGPRDSSAIVLTADGRPVAATRTGPSGQYRVEVDPDALTPGLVELRAIARSESPGWRDGLSGVLRVVVPPAPPPSPLWTWIPVAIAVTAIAGAAWRRRARSAPARVPPPVAPPPVAAFERAVDVTQGDGALTVHVLDALTGRPLEATVILLPADARPAGVGPPDGPQWTTRADGTVRVSGSGDLLWVGAAGHAPACHACRCPPGGRAIVRLLPIRAQIQRVYEGVLRAAGRPPLRFGRETPRQAAPVLAERGRDPEAIEALTRVVEAACFGRDPPGLEALAAAYALAGRTDAGTGPRAPGPSGPRSDAP